MLGLQIARNVLFVWLCLLGSACKADIIIDSYSPATNDRFTGGPGFVAAGFNLSGVGQSAAGWWATAISRNVIISAFHAAPSGMVYFYAGNDPAVTPITRQIVSGEKIGSTDLYVGVLDEVLPDNIAHYAIANLPLSGPPPDGSTFYVTNAGAYQGLNTYMFGRSPVDETIPNDNRFVYNDQAVGRNRISGYAENVPFEGNTDADALVLRRDSPLDPNYVQYEAFFQGGDSGGPTFADLGGELVLLGTNAWIVSDISGINYVGNQNAAINAYVAVHAVPEPSSLALMAVAGGVMIWRQRRVVRARAGSCV